jgi:hypothetical protein
MGWEAPQLGRLNYVGHGLVVQQAGAVAEFRPPPATAKRPSRDIAPAASTSVHLESTVRKLAPYTQFRERLIMRQMIQDVNFPYKPLIGIISLQVHLHYYL